MKTTQFDINGFSGYNTRVFNNGTFIGNAVRCNSGRFSLTYIPSFVRQIEKSKFNTVDGIEFTSIALRNQINKQVIK